MNIPYKKANHFKEDGTPIKGNPFPYINESPNRRQRRAYLHTPGGGKSYLYVLPTGKYRVVIQVIREIIERKRVLTHSTKNSKVKTIYGKVINRIRHSIVTGNIQK